MTIDLQKAKEQTQFYLASFSKLAQQFDQQGNEKLREYWKGQVFGIVKMIDLYGIDIDTKYWLNQLP